MNRSTFVATVAFTMLASCRNNLFVDVKPEVDVQIVNRSSHSLQNAVAQFGDHVCEWGNVGKTFSAGYGFFPHPITLQTELRWDEDGESTTKKLDLTGIYIPGKSGRLTFTVEDGGVTAGFLPR
jgi:hypothetical protein